MRTDKGSLMCPWCYWQHAGACPRYADQPSRFFGGASLWTVPLPLWMGLINMHIAGLSQMRQA